MCVCGNPYICEIAVASLGQPQHFMFMGPLYGFAIYRFMRHAAEGADDDTQKDCGVDMRKRVASHLICIVHEQRRRRPAAAAAKTPRITLAQKTMREPFQQTPHFSRPQITHNIYFALFPRAYIVAARGCSICIKYHVYNKAICVFLLLLHRHPRDVYICCPCLQRKLARPRRRIGTSVLRVHGRLAATTSNPR